MPILTLSPIFLSRGSLWVRPGCEATPWGQGEEGYAYVYKFLVHGPCTDCEFLPH